MSLDDDIAILEQVPLFEGFARDQLRLLAFGAENRRLSAGAVLYRQGAYAEGGFVIRDGIIELHSGNGTGPVVETVGRGGLVGQMAMISATDHVTTAVSPQGGAVLKIARPLFRRMLEEYPDLAERLHERIRRELAVFVARLDRVRRDLDSVPQERSLSDT